MGVGVGLAILNRESERERERERGGHGAHPKSQSQRAGQPASSQSASQRASQPANEPVSSLSLSVYFSLRFLGRCVCLSACPFLCLLPHFPVILWLSGEDRVREGWEGETGTERTRERERERGTQSPIPENKTSRQQGAQRAGQPASSQAAS